MNLGQKIIELRKMRGVSQERLAELAGVSRQTVSKWELDKVQPNAENIKTLSEIFSVSADYFFGYAPLKEVLKNPAPPEKTDKKPPKRNANLKENKKAEIAAEKPRVNFRLCFLIAVPLLAAVFAALVAVTVWLGINALSNEAFIAMLVLSSVIFAVEATLILTAVLRRKTQKNL